MTRSLSSVVSLVLGPLAVSLAISACSSGPPPPNEGSYVEQIEARRAAKDAFFRDTGDSDNPIPPGRQADFLPLLYYPVDPEYRVPAALEVSPDQPTFDMPTSTGKMRRMTQVGLLKFTLKAQPMALVAFAGEGPRGAPDMSQLFLPFSDSTSGTDTYVAGRYLDLSRTPTGLYVIDFNDAYSPYCAYNASFECPLPPRANRLTLPILSGERVRLPRTASAQGEGD